MITLYYAPDNASLIVRILLEELQIPYRTVLVDRSKQAQQSDAYLKLNPSGLIPVCIINEEPVYETAAIILTLADLHNNFTVPASSQMRPQFLKWLFFISNSVHADLRMRFYPEKFVASESIVESDFNQKTLQRLNRHLLILNAAYANSQDIYLFMSEPGIADIYLAVCLRWLQLYPLRKKGLRNRGEFSLQDYPAIVSMLKTLEQRPALIRACEQEGITGKVFSEPEFADPPEGVAL